MSPGKHWGHPAITHLSSWRPPPAVQWELNPPKQPSSRISRQEGGPHPWTSQFWFSLSQGQGEEDPPEQAPPCQAEGQCRPLFAGSGVPKGHRQAQRWKESWALSEEEKLSWCCHQGPSRMQATQLWPPSFKEMEENVGQCGVCLPYQLGSGPSSSSPDPQRSRSPRWAGRGADTEELTLGSLPQAHCMWDSALSGLGSGIRTSSSESLLGDVSPPDERLWETRAQRLLSQPVTPYRPPRPGKNICNTVIPVLDP